jgi:hypothetical protein
MVAMGCAESAQSHDSYRFERLERPEGFAFDEAIAACHEAGGELADLRSGQLSDIIHACKDDGTSEPWEPGQGSLRTCWTNIPYESSGQTVYSMMVIPWESELAARDVERYPAFAVCQFRR